MSPSHYSDRSSFLSNSSDFVAHFSVFASSTYFVKAVQAGEDEFYAGRSNSGLIRRIYVEGCFPDRWNVLEPLRVRGTWQKITHFDPHALVKYVSNLTDTMLACVLFENHFDSVG